MLSLHTAFVFDCLTSLSGVRLRLLPSQHPGWYLMASLQTAPFDLCPNGTDRTMPSCVMGELRVCTDAEGLTCDLSPGRKQVVGGSLQAG